MGILVLWIANIVCLSSVPPVSRDALTHHLRVPQLYLEHGGMVELPNIEFSYYPMNLDLLYLAALWAGNDILPKFLHFGFGLAVAALLFRFITQRLGAAYGWFGVFFFLSLPIVTKLSITVYVDLGLVFFLTAALMQLIHWAEDCFPHRRLIWAGILCGLGLGTKYNGLIGLLILTLALPILRYRYYPRDMVVGLPQDTHAGLLRVLGEMAIFIGFALLVFSPWMLRNLYWQGNPLFPLYDGLFNPQNAVAVPALDPLSLRRMIYGESLWQILLVPLRIFFQGQDNNPQFFDGQLSAFLFLLSFVGVLSLGRDPGRVRSLKLFLLAFSVLFLLIAFFESNMRIRYVSPIIPPLVILSAYGLQNIVNGTRRIFERGRRLKGTHVGGWVGVVTAALVLSLNLPYTIQQWRIVDPLSYLSGKLDADAYIIKYRPEFELYRFANTTLDPDAKVLALFLGNRGYRCERDLVFDIPGFQRAMKNSKDVLELSQTLRSQGFSHLMINHRLFDSWASSNFTKLQLQNLSRFSKEAIRPLLITESGQAVYELVSMKEK